MVQQKMSPVTKGRKFKQVLEGARTVFLREGFAGASVDDIAGEARVSKATLYSYFPDKELMFSEVFRAELALDGHQPVTALVGDRQAAEGLPLIVRALSLQMVSASGVQSHRVRVAESRRFPELAREYHEQLWVRQREEIRSYLERWTQRGELEITDFELASEQLVALASALIRDRAVFLGPDSVTESQIRRVTTGAARMFMSAYAPRYNGAPRVPGEPAMRPSDRAKTVPPME